MCNYVTSVIHTVLYTQSVLKQHLYYYAWLPFSMQQDFICYSSLLVLALIAHKNAHANLEVLSEPSPKGSSGLSKPILVIGEKSRRTHIFRLCSHLFFVVCIFKHGHTYIIIMQCC